MVQVLGLDVSTRTGFTLMCDQYDSSGEQEFPQKKGMARVLAFSDWLHAKIVENNPTLVVFENYGGPAYTLRTLMEIGTVMRLMCYIHKVPYIEVPPAMLKKFVTGKGTASKEEMVQAVRERFDCPVSTHNMADAFGLAMIGYCALGSEHPATYAPYQLEVLEQVKLQLTAKS